MLIDEAKVTLKGGKGGDGRASFYKGPMRGPDGGNGGKGGDLYLQASSDLTLLNQFSAKHYLSAQNGEDGGANKRTGKNGQDLTIFIPVGSEVIDLETQKKLEFSGVDQKVLFCKGGVGGRGNFELRSSVLTTPKHAEPGEEGQEKKVEISLKLIADFGLIGLPNAGKSSLLNELTNAKASVASYPFTTLEPNLGVINGKVIADIPGLIEGASTGKGLGIKFLKHIEKVKILLHCISVESEDIIKEYQSVEKELKEYNKELLNLERIILLTKSDLVSENDLKQKIKKLEKFKKKILPVSIHDFDSIEELKKILT